MNNQKASTKIKKLIYLMSILSLNTIYLSSCYSNNSESSSTESEQTSVVDKVSDTVSTAINPVDKLQNIIKEQFTKQTGEACKQVILANEGGNNYTGMIETQSGKKISIKATYDGNNFVWKETF